MQQRSCEDPGPRREEGDDGDENDGDKEEESDHDYGNVVMIIMMERKNDLLPTKPPLNLKLLDSNQLPSMIPASNGRKPSSQL